MIDSNRFNLAYVLVAIVGVLLVHDAWTSARTVAHIPYSEFQQLLREDQVKEVVVSANEIQGELKAAKDGRSRFVTTRVEPELSEALDQHGVAYAARNESTFLPTLLSWVVPAAVFVGVWLLLGRLLAKRLGGGSGGLMSIGKSKAKVYVETDTKVSFADVAGVEDAKAELRETVAFLRDPESHGRLGARAPKGILLVGPPGTGKTLLAKAVAGEASVPFFSISGSEFVEMFVGVGAARVRDLFEQARQKAPCIIFIDELDALGKARNTQAGFGGHDEKEQTLNQLLVELDGFDPSSGIVLLGATNRPEVLDPALLRAGRFDRQVLVDRPDKHGRLAILEVHARKVEAAADLRLEEIAALTPGFTGADLANLVNEAALAATRRGADAVALQDFRLAIERIVAGLERKNRLLNEREREIVAHHEMGHALVAAALPGTDPVHKVSIIPRGIGALGYTIQRPTEDRYLMTREELEVKMTVLLGGRAAERVVYGHLSTGAADDLAKTTSIARSMVTRYAMVPKLGHVAYEEDRGGFLGGPAATAARHSNETTREIDDAVRQLVQAAFERAVEILERNRALLVASARELLEKESLDEEELEPIFQRIRRRQETAAEPSPAALVGAAGAAALVGAAGAAAPAASTPARAARPGARREQVVASPVEDGHHGGVVDLALHGDGVEALLHRLEPAQHADAVLFHHLLLHHRGRREQPDSVGPEHLEQGAVLELGDDARSYPLALEPAVELAAQGQVLEGQEQGRPIQGFGEAALEGAHQLGRAKQGDARLAQCVVEGVHAAAAGHRRVGDDDVQGVERQIGEELVVGVLVANQLHGLGEGEGRLQQASHHQLGDQVDDAHVQAQRLADGAPLDRVHELAAEREDVLGVVVDHPTHLGEGQPAPHLGEELLAQGFLERADLCAQGRVRHVQDLARGDQPPLARNDPEVVQVVVVEPLHGPTICRPSRRGTSIVPPELHAVLIFATGHAMPASAWSGRRRRRWRATRRR